MALLDDLANPSPGGDLSDFSGASTFASPSPGGGGSSAITEKDQKTSPDGEPVYYSQSAGRYLTAPAYAAQQKIVAPVDPIVHKRAEARVADVQNAARAVQTLADTSNNFASLNAATKTGFLQGLPMVPEMMQQFGMRGAENYPQLDSDTALEATQKTKAISSRPSQLEFVKMLGAVQNKNKPEASNTVMQQQTNKANTMGQAMSSFFQTYVDTHKTDVGMDDAWRAFRNQHFDAQGNFSHEPISPQGQVTAAKQTQAARQGQSQGQAPPPGSTIDLFGRVIGAPGG